MNDSEFIKKINLYMIKPNTMIPGELFQFDETKLDWPIWNTLPYKNYFYKPQPNQLIRIGNLGYLSPNTSFIFLKEKFIQTEIENVKFWYWKLLFENKIGWFLLRMV